MWFRKLNSGKKKTIELINHLELLALNANNENTYVNPRGIVLNERDYLMEIVHQTREYIEYNEWFIGLEIAVSNLMEVDYKLESTGYDMVVEAFKGIKTDYDIDEFINSSKK